METLGVGMAGFGFIGRVHAHAHHSLPLFYDPLPLRTRLVGVCTTSEESGRKALERGGFEFSTTDYRELLNRSDIHIIDICSPNDAHFPLLRDALKAGKHIYCDKPLTLTLPEAEEIVELAASVPTVQQMTFNYRFAPAIMRARQLMEQGFCGSLLGFRTAYLHAGYVDPARPYSWRTNFARSGGGAVADLGAHMFDLLRFLLVPCGKNERGGELHSVSATLQTIIKERPDARDGSLHPVDVDDIAIAQCRLQGGAMGTAEASRLATGVQDELRLEIHGEKGALRFQLMEPNWLEAYDNNLEEEALGGERGFRRIECVSRYPKPYALGAVKNGIGWLQFHIQSLFDFTQNIALHQNGQPVSSFSPTFADGLAAQKIIAACQASAVAESRWTIV